MLRIRMLGSFSVDIDGYPLTQWPRKSALHLLQLLALSTEHRITRVQAAQALARESSEEQMRQVSDALYALRGASPTPGVKLGNHVESSAEAIWLNLSLCEVDIDGFEQNASASLAPDATPTLLEAVVAQCNRPLLSELSPAVEAVAAPVRSHLEQLYLASARALVARRAQQGENDRAIVALRAVLRIVPSDEQCHRQLIELFAMLGRYQEAEQQLSLCRATLARDLGVKPSAATIDSIRLARERQLAATASPERPPDGTLTAQPRYLPPKALVKLIGREPVVHELTARLTGVDAPRLLTLCGIGGIGKTQLALEVAHACATQRRNGAVVVDLTRVAEAKSVVRAIAMALGLKRTDGRSWQERLQQHLEALELLLVLDNFEHVHRAAPCIALLLELLPAVTVLCTSRVPLLVRGEEVFDVKPLAIQPRQQRLADTGLAGVAPPSDAAALFVRAAQSQRASAIDTTGDLSLIEEVCRRLDGLPLAIELAAARACVVGARRLVDELSNHAAALVNPMQDAPSRHTSLRDLLASTCAVLDADAQTGLSYVSHFEAGFTLAQLVESRLFSAADSERVLAQLLDARIVSFDGQRSQLRQAIAPLRFRLLETMRSYARHSGWLDESTQDSIHHAFVDAWHRFGMTVAAARSTPLECEHFDELDAEFENVAGAVQLAARLDRKRAREMLTALWTACVRRGHIFDWLAWFEELKLLDGFPEQDADAVNLMIAASEVYRTAAQYPAAQHYGEAAMREVNRPGVDRVGAHLALAYAYLIQSNLVAGASQARAALTAARECADSRGELDAHTLLTTLEHRLGNFVLARTHATNARALCNSLAIDMPIRLVGNVALSLRLCGELDGAIALYASTASKCMTEGEFRAEAIMTLDRAECEMLALRLDDATQSMKRAATLVGQQRMKILQCVLHQQLGALHVLRGEYEQACAELTLSMTAMPEASSFEQADITLLWLIQAQRLCGDHIGALRSAFRVTSQEVKVRRYIAPFVVESAANALLATGGHGNALELIRVAQRLRHLHALESSPAERHLLMLAAGGSSSGAGPLPTTTSFPASLEDSLALCHERVRQALNEHSPQPV